MFYGAACKEDVSGAGQKSSVYSLRIFFKDVPRTWTDRALLGGMLGFETDDARIRDAFDWAKKMGVEYEYVIDEKTVTDHPNTADMEITGVNGHHLSVRGESIGGGKIKIVRINGIDVEFT